MTTLPRFRSPTISMSASKRSSFCTDGIIDPDGAYQGRYQLLANSVSGQEAADNAIQTSRTEYQRAYQRGAGSIQALQRQLCTIAPSSAPTRTNSTAETKIAIAP